MGRVVDSSAKRGYVAILVRLQGRACRYCGCQLTEVRRGHSRPRDTDLTLDHVVPIARGGATRLHNLVLACYACNQSKRGRLLHEWICPIDRSMVQFRENRSA